MSQSSVIAGGLLAAFIVWLAVNDRLQTYTAVLWGKTTQPKPASSSGTSTSGGGSASGAKQYDGGISEGSNGWTPSLDSSSMSEYGGYVATVLEFL